MACLKMLLSGSLMIIITTTLITANSILEYYPRHYDIKLKAYINNIKFYSECNITMDIYSETQIINLYAENLCIIDINLIQPLEGFDKDDKKIKIIKSNYSYNNETHIISIYSTEVLQEKCIINVKYKAALHNYNEIKTFSRSRKNSVYETWLPEVCLWNSHMQKTLPCWDNMQFLSTFKISILHHKKFQTLSNMAREEEKADENGMMWTHFDSTPKTYIYLVVVVIGERHIRQFHLPLPQFHLLYRVQDDMIEDNVTLYYQNVVLWSRAIYQYDLWTAQDVMKIIIPFIHEKWKILRKIWKIDNIVIPHYADNDVVNIGLIMYRESDIMYNMHADSVVRKVEVARLIGYKITEEMSLHFQICSLSPWLHKALATFMGAYVADKALPQTRMIDLFVIHTQHEILRWDFFQFSMSHAAISEVSSYYKGSVILRMLLHAFTEELFWKHIIQENILCVYEEALKTAYINTQKWNLLVRTQEKFDAIDSVEQLKSWLNHKYYPIINVTRKYDQSQFTIEDVTIEIVNITKNLIIPLTYTTQIQLNFNNTSPNIWLKQVYQESYDNQSNNIQHIQKIKNLTNDQWIIFNLQQTGYYRVNYDKENWKLISRYLKSKNYINIHVLNRAQIIDDAFHLMLAQQIEPSLFWDIVTYLEQETDYVAWYPMFKALEYMSRVFTIDTYGKNIYVRVKMLSILHFTMKEIRYTEFSYDADDDHKKSLRQEAVKWSCVLGDRDCIKDANNKLRQNFLYAWRQHIVLPWWKAWTYCYGLYSAKKDPYYEDDLWKNMFLIWVRGNDHKISNSLTCIQNIPIIKSHLKDLRNMIMTRSSENHILRLSFINDFFSMLARHMRKNVIRRYVFKNYLEIIPRRISTVATLTVIINHLYEDKHLTELENFVLEDLNREKDDITKKILYFTYSSKILSHINKQYTTNILKIRNKIKIRRIQIKNHHNFVQAFLLKINKN
ncbi:aminopeptidase N-like isoform X1 [Cataglyphis hispanica]|uniref:aminopeptidase N-like isoform X1 n=1 Tax=Cataglyphis hispanica TaxID=1086592 RepID=UPI002180791C|nr:aminopeptidase N-like isoform X1 [Cataglyphis hispanica]XP_050459307.1 aminopeptidase N-like isoform X1 [Cataglyphis hispanica]